MTVKELRAKLGNLQTDLDGLEKKKAEEKREFSKDELDSIETKLNEQEKILCEIKEIERSEAIGQRMAKGKTEFRGAGETIEIHNEADEAKYSFGEFLCDVHRNAINRETTPRLDMHQKRNIEIARKETRATGLNEAIPSEGGFLVGTDFNQTLIQKEHETDILWGRTTTIPVTGPNNGLVMNTIDETSRATGSRLGGIRVYRLNEGGTKTPSKPKFGRIELRLEKMIGLCYATDENLQDYHQGVRAGVRVQEGRRNHQRDRRGTDARHSQRGLHGERRQGNRPGCRDYRQGKHRQDVGPDVVTVKA
jgi:HK97 family phage major capsid protein